MVLLNSIRSKLGNLGSIPNSHAIRFEKNNDKSFSEGLKIKEPNSCIFKDSQDLNLKNNSVFLYL